MSELIGSNELPSILTEFASYKLVIQGCSRKTVEEYLLDLRTFIKYIIALRSSISPEAEDFDKINISVADIEFFKSIKTSEIYEKHTPPLGHFSPASTPTTETPAFLPPLFTSNTIYHQRH